MNPWFYSSLHLLSIKNEAIWIPIARNKFWGSKKDVVTPLHTIALLKKPINSQEDSGLQHMLLANNIKDDNVKS